MSTKWKTNSAYCLILSLLVGCNSGAVLDTNGQSSSAVSGQPVITTLQERRPSIQFPNYTTDEKQLVAQQAQIFLRDLYVNHYHKMKFYGDHINAVARIADVSNRATSLTPEELNLAIHEIFTSQRDLHLNYALPQPYSCYVSFLPLEFVDVMNEQAFSDDPVLVVTDVYYGYHVYSSGIESIAIGDRLVSYNGLDPERAIAKNVQGGSGANLSGSKSRAIRHLGYRYHKYNLLPNADQVELVFRRPDNSTYTATIPWMSYLIGDCLSQEQASSISPSASDDPIQVNAATGLSIDEFEAQYGKITQELNPGSTISPQIELLEGFDPIVQFGRFSNSHGTFGYVRLSSFVPGRTSVYSFLLGFQSMLEVLDQETDGLIIDVRNNGGGYITISDLLPQMFSDEPVGIEGFRMLATQLNKEVVSHPWFAYEWLGLVNEALENNRRFTSAIPLTWPGYRELFQRAYHHPVAILTNANCYSACDIFSASMQDNGLAKIWGEHNKTGAGGANVVTTDFFLSLNLPSGTIQPLPYGQSMRVSWRQSIRVGESAGQVLEDWGVVRDESAIKTYEDVIETDASILRRITSDLGWEASDFDDEDDW